MSRAGIEPRSRRPLTSTLPSRPISRYSIKTYYISYYLLPNSTWLQAFWRNLAETMRKNKMKRWRQNDFGCKKKKVTLVVIEKLYSFYSRWYKLLLHWSKEQEHVNWYFQIDQRKICTLTNRNPLSMGLGPFLLGPKILAVTCLCLCN